MIMARILRLGSKVSTRVSCFSALVCFKTSNRHCRLFGSQAGSSAVVENPLNESQVAESVTANNALNVNISYPAFMVWGANTTVGKTLVSAGLSASILSGQKQKVSDSHDGEKTVAGGVKDVLYLKPLQTGYPNDSDARFVARQVCDILMRQEGSSKNKISISNQTAQASSAVQRALNSEDAFGAEDGLHWKRLGSWEEQDLQVSREPDSAPDKSSVEQTADLSSELSESDPPISGSLPSHLTCSTLWAWCDPVSPHLVAKTERLPVADFTVQNSLATALETLSSRKRQGTSVENAVEGTSVSDKWAIIETAGGVASPGPSGNLQCDIYRPFRLPGVLVGDGQLGGITTTISALESLRGRGYDIDAIIFPDFGLGNHSALLRHLRGRVPVFVLPPIPTEGSLRDWYAGSEEVFAQLQLSLEESHARRLLRLQSMPMIAQRDLWWPFTQHTMVPTGDITVIDSRCGESFSVHKSSLGSDENVLQQQFDGCASWWTQGPDAELQGEIARDVGYAAARYGHVMYPENVHEPALQCAELLLQTVGKGWAKRVYYSDNGSTAIEIALKMAFRKFATDHSLLRESNGAISAVTHPFQLKVLALRGSYHGDTLGAMEAQAPSPYTGFLQQPWYSGRGCFLDPPSVFLHLGQWQLHLPQCLQDAEVSTDSQFVSKEHVFDLERDHTALANTYKLYISQHLSSFQATNDTAVGALIIEPVIHAAGGMEMVDPLFQRLLVQECQRQRIPVIFDEVFTGCWRLGYQSAAELLNCTPDIACYSKLLTGGTVPLAATLVREDVFEVFKGNSKLDALLHGHSYTAHAVGCTAALTSQAYFSDPARNSNLMPDGRLQELWDPALLDELSFHPSLQRITALGTLFSCEIQTSSEDSGYASMSTRGLIQRLRKDGIYARPLGNVIYLLCGPLTSPQTCSALLETLTRHI